MTLYEYNSLDPDERANLLWEHGTFLMHRFTDEHTIALHGVFNFFVEVFYDSVENRIVKLRAFSSVNQLEVYLDEIEIGSVE